MKLDLSTPYKSLSFSQVEEVIAPTVEGQIMILPGHAHLLSELEEGTLTCRSQTDSKGFPVRKGVIEVRDDHVIVLCDEADLL